MTLCLSVSVSNENSAHLRRGISSIFFDHHLFLFCVRAIFRQHRYAKHKMRPIAVDAQHRIKLMGG